MDSDRLYWLGFSAFPGIGPLRFRLLLDYFKTAKAAWKAPVSELSRIGLGSQLIQKFDDFRKEFDPLEYAKRAKELDVSIVTLSDEKYPKLLKQIPDAPFLLYVKGKKIDPKAWDLGKTIAIVGTRKITSYGREITHSLTQDLVMSGFTIVSGLAVGVDAVAHKTAIDAGGKTIAVLGCGVDCCNPSSNQFLYDQIIDGNGIVVSEFPLSRRAEKGFFPARNRIVSGLSLGTVVTEGAEDSGALITARFAAEQGREVFAVPGPITSLYSSAPIKLIKDGARLVTSVSDILDEFNMPSSYNGSKSRARYQSDNPEEQSVIRLLSRENMQIDDIIRALGWEKGKAASILSLLEIKGILANDGGVYSLK